VEEETAATEGQKKKKKITNKSLQVNPRRKEKQERYVGFLGSGPDRLGGGIGGGGEEDVKGRGEGAYRPLLE